MKRKTDVKNLMLLITRQVDFDSSAKGVCEAFIQQQTWTCPELHKEKIHYLNLINRKTDHPMHYSHCLTSVLQGNLVTYIQ